jgi:hypothetical protein
MLKNFASNYVVTGKFPGQFVENRKFRTQIFQFQTQNVQKRFPLDFLANVLCMKKLIEIFMNNLEFPRIISIQTIIHIVHACQNVLNNKCP